VFLINSRSAAFAAPQSLTDQGGHLANLRPAVLPSSLRIVLSIACVYSTRPPVLVYSTVSSCFHYELFPENETLLTYDFAFAPRIVLIDEIVQIALKDHRQLYPIFRIQRRIFLSPDSLVLRQAYSLLRESHFVHP
jgi:hypothetical protein